MGLRDFFRKQETSPEVEYIGVGDFVNVALPSGRVFRGLVAETDVANQLAKIAYLFDNKLAFMWMAAYSLERINI